MNLLHEIGSHLTGLEQLQVMITKDLRLGIGETLDIRLIEVEEGRVALEVTLDVHLHNPVGTVHDPCKQAGGFVIPFSPSESPRIRWNTGNPVAANVNSRKLRQKERAEAVKPRHSRLSLVSIS